MAMRHPKTRKKIIDLFASADTDTYR